MNKTIEKRKLRLFAGACGLACTLIAGQSSADSVSGAAAPSGTIRLPVRLQPGLWIVTTHTTAAQGPQKAQVCMDASTEDSMIQFSGGALLGQLCSERSIRNHGKDVTVDAMCAFAGYEISSHVRLNFASATAFSAASTASVAPPLFGQGQTVSRSEARWSGACKPPMQPGDMIAPDGRRANLHDLLGMASSLLLPSWGGVTP
jgi:hypothetical protein